VTARQRRANVGGLIADTAARERLRLQSRLRVSQVALVFGNDGLASRVAVFELVPPIARPARYKAAILVAAADWADRGLTNEWIVHDTLALIRARRHIGLASAVLQCLKFPDVHSRLVEPFCVLGAARKPRRCLERDRAAMMLLDAAFAAHAADCRIIVIGRLAGFIDPADFASFTHLMSLALI
jgi:hypothetical protein